jgi:branched-chain amino acid aminotransferase
VVDVSSADLPVGVDGQIVAADAARISALDATFTQGLGAFDTLLVEDGVAHFRARHLARLHAACTFLGLDTTALSRLDEWIDGYIAVLPKTALGMRATVTRGADGAAGTIVLAARTFERAPAAGVTLGIERRFALCGDVIERHKTTSRARHALAHEAARRAGAFDALLCHTDGDVADATTANVWVHVDGALVTPPVDRGALPGIVRGVLLEEMNRAGDGVHERPLALSDLERADEIFLTSSLQRVVGVRSITDLVDGLPGADGPACRHARALVVAAERRRS